MLGSTYPRVLPAPDAPVTRTLRFRLVLCVSRESLSVFVMSMVLPGLLSL